MRLILASSSPRRRDLMKLLGVDFEVISSRVKEVLTEEANFGSLVEKLALKKAEEVYERTFEERLVIGADTIVVLENRILGKPSDLEEAREFLKILSGKEHVVYSGVAFVWDEGKHTLHESTKVKFRNLPEDLIDFYVENYRPLDKAGAYGIQDLGAVFVERIEGDYYTVMGLPIGKVWEFLNEKGWWK